MSRVVADVAFYGLPLFLAAWTLHWRRAWALLGVVALTTAVTVFSVYPQRPDLLEERSKTPVQKGQPAADKLLLLAQLVTFLGLLVFIALDARRFHLLGATRLPVATGGLILFVAGAAMITWAMRENAFASAVVRHQEERGQVVVQSGPYGIVRHPMVAGSIPSTVGVALWLGSPAAALLAAAPIAVSVLRVIVEERVLRHALPGYVDYARSVRWRLVPHVW
ncbi:MAG TPA: isoprenylcysteine carboxylmethyltransferase family protein [Polyangia bacterium]